MFGHQNNDQADAVQTQPPNSDIVTTALSPAYPTVPPTDFNPALPTPGTDFGGTTTNPAPSPAVTGALPSAPLTNPSDSELLDIKQRALSQLSPLVNQLEQSPEEKFRTTMMLIQASDNQALIKDAYAAAEAITDEKAKAQALLDIVNEINYFTQHHQS